MEEIIVITTASILIFILTMSNIEDPKVEIVCYNYGMSSTKFVFKGKKEFEFEVLHEGLKNNSEGIQELNRRILKKIRQQTDEKLPKLTLHAKLDTDFVFDVEE